MVSQAELVIQDKFYILPVTNRTKGSVYNQNTNSYAVCHNNNGLRDF